MTPPPASSATHDRTALVHPLDDVLPGEARVLEAAEESLAGRRRGFRGAWPFLGPAFIAAVAYVDPGNFATNMAAGARYGYLLLWVVLMANLMAMLIQSMSSKLGIATGKNLPEVCRRALLAPHELPPLAAGRGDRDGDRPRGVHGRCDRAPAPVRDPALPGRAPHRRRLVRDPGAAGEGLPAARGRDRVPDRSHRPRVRAPGVHGPSGHVRHRARPLRARLRRDGERPPRRRDPRGHGHAARDLPALGAHPAPARGRNRADEAADRPLRARRRGDRDESCGDREPEHACHRRGGLPHARAHGDRGRPGRCPRRARHLPRRECGSALRNRAPRVRALVLERGDACRPGRHAGVHREEDPALRPAFRDDGAGARRHRHRRGRRERS